MAARSVNSAIAKEISQEVDKFYEKLELRYYSSIPRDDVTQKLALQDLFKELSVLKEQTMKCHSETSVREKLKFKKCDLHRMACNEVSYWRKTLMRRQFLTAKHSHPWIIEFTLRLQEDIFKHIVDILTSTSRFAVETQTGRTNKEQVVEVTSKPKLQQMLRFCLGNESTTLKREFPGKGRPNIVIDRENPFTITYNYGNEVVKVHCHYGAWNSDNVPQFI